MYASDFQSEGLRVSILKNCVRFFRRLYGWSTLRLVWPSLRHPLVPGRFSFLRRLVFHRMVTATHLSPPCAVDNATNAPDNTKKGVLRGSSSKTVEAGPTDASATQQLREALERAFGVSEADGISAVEGNPSGVAVRDEDSGAQRGVQARARGHEVGGKLLCPPVLLGQGAVVSLSVREGITRGTAKDLALWEEGKECPPDGISDAEPCRRVVDFVVQFAGVAPGVGSRRGPTAEPSHETDIREGGGETRGRVLYSVVASAADAEELISQALVGGEVFVASSGGFGTEGVLGKHGMRRRVEELGGVEDKVSGGDTVSSQGGVRLFS